MALSFLKHVLIVSAAAGGVASGGLPANAFAQAPARMVGKGSVTGDARTGGTASYAYIVPCDATTRPPSEVPFEIRVTGGRYNGQRLRLTRAQFLECRDDPTVPTPAGGVDTLVGFGDFSVSAPIGAPSAGVVIWAFVDGGRGGAKDRASLTFVEFPGRGDVFFPFAAAPPGPFPGSTQPTGFNTAQPFARGVPAAAIVR